MTVGTKKRFIALVPRQHRFPEIRWPYWKNRFWRKKRFLAASLKTTVLLSHLNNLTFWLPILFLGGDIIKHFYSLPMLREK
jgi:hypothetical protein